MSLYQFGPFELDAEQLLLCVGDVPVAPGPKVVETLLALLEHPGEVLSKTALLDRVLWRPLRRRGTGLIAMLVVSIGLSLFVRYVFLYQFGGRTRPFKDYAVQRAWNIGPVDIACVPIGGPLSATKTAELIAQLDPRIVVAMPLDEDAPGMGDALAKFFHEMGGEPTPQPRLSVTMSSLPAETTAVLLESRGKS